MDAVILINITFDVLCIVISLIILLCLFFESAKHAKTNRLFRYFVLSNIGLLLSDAIAWYMTGNVELYAFYLIRVSNYLHFLFGPLTVTTISIYMYAYIEAKGTVLRRITRAVIVICAFSLILATISQFTGMYYTIDENNVYHRGNLIYLHKGIMMAVLAMNVGIIFYYRKTLKRRASLFFLVYMTLPIIMLFIQALFYGISISNVASTLTMLLIYIGVQVDKSAQFTQNIAVVERQLELQSEHFNMLQTHIDETKKARHDLRHHLTMIQAFIETGEKEKLTDYVSQYKSLLLDDTFIFCDNIAVNSLLWYYYAIAKNEDVNFNAKLGLSENIGISDTDLCIIFGNSIENAIEACRKVDGVKYIKIISMLTENLLAITIDNSFNGELKKDGDTFISTKHERKGIGTISVKAVAEKYGGTVEYSAIDSEFQVSIMLRVPT